MIHSRKWEYDWSMDGYYCRMLIEADTTLNGKLELELLNKGN